MARKLYFCLTCDNAFSKFDNRDKNIFCSMKCHQDYRREWLYHLYIRILWERGFSASQISNRLDEPIKSIEHIIFSNNFPKKKAQGNKKNSHLTSAAA